VGRERADDSLAEQQIRNAEKCSFGIADENCTRVTAGVKSVGLTLAATSVTTTGQKGLSEELLNAELDGSHYSSPSFIS
jgi:hypothetical protein